MKTRITRTVFWVLVASAAVVLAGCAGAQSPTDDVEFGFRGTVLTQTSVEFEDEQIGFSAITVPVGVVAEVDIRFGSQVQARSCDPPELRRELGLDRPCPEFGATKLMYSMVWFVDLKRVPGPAGLPQTLVHSTDGTLDISTVTLTVPPLAEGRHCVVAVFAEDGVSILEGQFPDHSPVVTFTVVVGQGDTDYCVANKAPNAPLFEDSVGVACTGVPSLVTAPGVLEPGANVAAQVPGCETGQALLILRADGTLVFDAVELPPLDDPSGFYLYQMSLPKDEAVRALVVALETPGTLLPQQRAAVSYPVLVPEE